MARAARARRVHPEPGGRRLVSSNTLLGRNPRANSTHDTPLGKKVAQVLDASSIDAQISVAEA